MRVMSSAAVVECCRWGVLLFIIITADVVTCLPPSCKGRYMPRGHNFFGFWPLAWQNAKVPPL